MRVEQIMFSLIRSAVCEQELSVDMVTGLSVEEYSELYRLSKKHDLAHLIAWALVQKGMLRKNQTSEDFNKQLMLSIYRSDQRKCALEQICNILEEAQITYLPLKGAILCRYYPKEWLRTSCDIDVLIHKEDAEKAIQVLCHAGFLKNKDKTTHDHSLESPRGVHLELHYSLKSDDKLLETNHILEHVWKYTVLDNTNYYRYSMTSEIFMFYHIAHMAKHFLHGGCGIRSFIDLWLLEHRLPYNSKKLEGILTEAKLLDFYKAASKLSCVWLEELPHSSTTRHMENFILSGGTYGNEINSAMIKAAKGEGKISSFMRLMFLSRVNLEVVYPNLRKYPLLFPLYQVKRWFRIFKRANRNRILSMTNARKSVSQNEEEHTADLLVKLGLM